jgi:hypothetical protein
MVWCGKFFIPSTTTTGEAEKYLTVWHNEKHGGLVYNNKWAYDNKNKIKYLQIKIYNNDIRIIGSGYNLREK